MVNRRMRTRTYGGVRGGASDDPAYSITRAGKTIPEDQQHRRGLLYLASIVAA